MIQIAANEMAEEEEENGEKNDNQPNRYPMTNREHVSTDYFITFMFTSTHRIQASSRFFATVCALTSRQNAKRFFVQFQLHAAPRCIAFIRVCQQHKVKIILYLLLMSNLHALPMHKHTHTTRQHTDINPYVQRTVHNLLYYYYYYRRY